MCTLIEQSSSGWYLASPDLAVESPKYLLQIERGGVDFFKTRPPAGRGGGLSLQNLYFFLQNQYNLPWQKEAANHGQNWLFNRSNRLLSGRL